MIIRLCVILSMVACDLWAQGVSYVRYYRTEQDFIRGISMLATERMGVEHFRVFYDREDQPLSKGKIDAGGDLVSEEIFQYDKDGNLSRRSIRNENGKVESMFVYGDEEPLSREYTDYVYPGRNLREFADRVTHIRYGRGGRVTYVRFLSVDNVQWGSIEYDYFESGRVKQERWIRGPGEKTVRLFVYSYDAESDTYALTEYDSTGTVTSRVAVAMPARLLPPREGGQVEQGVDPDEIIRRRLPLFPDDPAVAPDLMYLRDGETLRVDIVRISDTMVRFKLFGEEDTLTIPLKKVGEIESRDGKILHPKLY